MFLSASQHESAGWTSSGGGGARPFSTKTARNLDNQELVGGSLNRLK